MRLAIAPYQRVFVTYGVALGVRSDSAALLDRMVAALPPDAVVSQSTSAVSWFSLLSSGTASSSGGRYGLYENDTKLDDGFRVTPLIEALMVAVRSRVAHAARDRLFVHAGAVAWRDGAIVMPGRSGTGKTTLVAALVRAGAEYYSDDYAVLDFEGKVHPYARPLSFRQGEYRRVRRSADEYLGGSLANRPLPVRLVLSCVYEPGATWAVTQRRLGEGAQAMLSNCLVARERPELALPVISLAAENAMVLAGVRGDADEAAYQVQAVVDKLLAPPFTLAPER